MKRRLVRAMALVITGVPFGFASIRAIQTGWDFRYFVIAVAGLLGAAAVVAVPRVYITGGTVARTVAAFVAAALLSVLAAMTIGTRLGPGLLVVAAAFACCFAAAVWLHLRARSLEE